jgi:hypothetical protein
MILGHSGMKKDEGGIKKIVDLLNVLFLCGEKDKV